MMTSSGIARDHPLYWTDDIPVCHQSAVGMSTNQIYRENTPSRRQGHECEDSNFRFRPETDRSIFLYGVFDGHDGSKLSNFAAQRFPAEILLGQLDNKMDDDEEILSVLYQAFASVEKAYLDSISDKLAEKCNLTERLPILQQAEVQGFTQLEAQRLYDKTLKQLQDIEQEISGGTSAVIALIINNKLYVASVGCCRALLCKTDSGGVLHVNPLTMDHNLNNNEEIQRLANLGLDIDKIRISGEIGSHPFTRTIGDYNLKLGYKEYELLSAASSDPIIAEPELSNAIELDESCRFLVLMSSGVYKNLEEAGLSNVNVQIASTVATEFAVQSTLAGVAQGVVDKIGRIHHDTFMTHSDNYRKDMCQHRDDMTLLLRNFNYAMPNSVSSPTNSANKPVAIPYNTVSGVALSPLSVLIPTNTDSELDDHRPMFTLGTLQNTRDPQHRSSCASSNSTQSGDDCSMRFEKRSIYRSSLPLDDDGKVKAYVDFGAFEKEFEKLCLEKQEELLTEMEAKPDYPTIPEEKEIMFPARDTSNPSTPNTDNAETPP